jgi:hypothetical protein
MQAELLHDRHRCEESKFIVNKSALKSLLENAGLYPDTEGILIVMKVQIINRLNYKRHILHDSIHWTYRWCHEVSHYLTF